MSLGDIELSKGNEPTFNDFLNQKFTIPSSIQVEAPTEMENLSSMVQDLIDGIMGKVLSTLQDTSSNLSKISKVSKDHLETIKEKSFSEEKLNKKLVEIHTTHYDRITEIQQKRDKLIAGRTDKEKKRDKDKSAAKTAIDLDPNRGFFSKVLGKGMVDLRSSIADSLDVSVFGVSVADSFKPLGNLIDKIDPSTTQEKNQSKLDKINQQIDDIKGSQGSFKNQEDEQRAVERINQLENEKKDIAKSDPKIAKQDQALIVDQQLELIKEQEAKTEEFRKAMDKALKDGDTETSGQLKVKIDESELKTSNLKKGLDASGGEQKVSQQSLDEIEGLSTRLNNLLEDRKELGIDRDNETHVFREEQIKILQEQLRQAKENSKISQTEQQERAADKQEAEIAKKEEKTWMEKLFASLSGGESDIKPEKEKGGFWGFLALTGMAIGALVATALAPFVVWLKSRLDIIKELMPDAMLNKIRDLFDSVKMKFADIKVSVLEKIDDIKKWFSNLKDDLIKKFEPVVTKFDELKGKLVKRFEPVTNFINSIGELFGKADKASPTLFQRMAKFLSFFDPIFGFFKGFFKGFKVVFGGLFRVLTKIPFIGQIIDFAVGIFKGFREGLDGLDLIVSGLAQVVAGGIGGTFDLLVDGLNWLLGLLGFDLKKSLGLGEDFSLEKMIREGLMELWNFLSDLTNIKDLLKNILPPSVKKLLAGKFPFLAEENVEDKAENSHQDQQKKLAGNEKFQKRLSTLPEALQKRYNRDVSLISADIKRGFIKRNKDGSLEYIDPKDRGKGKSTTKVKPVKTQPKSVKPVKTEPKTTKGETFKEISKDISDGNLKDARFKLGGLATGEFDYGDLTNDEEHELTQELSKAIRSKEIQNSAAQSSGTKTKALQSVQSQSDAIESDMKTKQSSPTSNTVVAPSTQDNSRRSQTINYLAPDKKVFGTSGGGWSGNW